MGAPPLTCRPTLSRLFVSEIIRSILHPLWLLSTTRGDQILPFDLSAASNIASAARPTPDPDDNVAEVAQWFESFPDAASQFGLALRQSIDEVLDGQRTGRFDIDQLAKTEKTYLGTKVEIVVQATFSLARGARMDYCIAGHDVDSKFTVGANWTIPEEADGHICLLMSANDQESRFRVGLLRIQDKFLNQGKNRDGKRSLSQRGREAVHWIAEKGNLPENILIGITQDDRDAIFNAGGGQARTNELFRRVQQKIINRNTVLTVARQADSPKRVRDARLDLRQEGIIILGHQGKHPAIAQQLGLPVPSKGSWVAVRITPAMPGSERRTIFIDGRAFTIADADDLIAPVPTV